MKYLKGFNESIGNSIESICKEYGIRNYIINSDGSVDVDDDVYIPPTFFGQPSNVVNLLKQKLKSPGTEKLTTLPLKFGRVSGYFACSFNRLTSLEGCPQSVGEFFECGSNKLTSLQGGPQSIGGAYFCNHNQIKDFKGVSEYFEGQFYCSGNPIYEIYSLFKTSKCIKWINEFDVIRGNKVILDRLEEVFHQLGMVIPENINLPSYEII